MKDSHLDHIVLYTMLTGKGGVAENDKKVLSFLYNYSNVIIFILI